MTKILLVEDDKSLSEIYSVRLRAEGYDILSASDGEQALALAIKEVPDLIISDVMMPNISGFDMLDILRSTTETRGIHVIMMTALSSDEQRQRGMALGADRYLVKSQVGIEDVVRTVHEVLGDASVPADTPAPLVNEPKRATIEPGPSARATEPAPVNNSPEKAESDNTKANELSPSPETPEGPASSSNLATNSTTPTPANPAPTDTAAAVDFHGYKLLLIAVCDSSYAFCFSVKVAFNLFNSCFNLLFLSAFSPATHILPHTFSIASTSCCLASTAFLAAS